MYDVAALGELLIDFAPLNTDEAGYPTVKANPGGAPGNYLAALAKYGAKTAFIGKVGNDAFGNLLISTMKTAGVETKGICIDPKVFTTLAFVSVDEEGDRSFSFARKPGADTCLSWEDVDKTIIENSKIFHFGTLSLTDEPAKTATVKAVEYARSLGKTVTFDPNLRLPLWTSAEEAKKQIVWGLGKADIVKISDEEVAFLWGCTPGQGAEKLLGEFGVSLAMITLGEKGCIMANKNGMCLVKTPIVMPVDTTGAGDIFGGAAVSCMLKLDKEPGELTVQEMMAVAAFAVAAASLSTENPGGIPSIPEKEAVFEIMQKNFDNML